MRSDSASCPYCNAELPALPPRGLLQDANGDAIANGLPAPRAAAYTACPRCGEPVPTERFPPTATGSPAPPSPAAPQSSIPERKRRTAQIVLAIMAGMAAMALIFALMTQKWRRDHDFRYKVNPTTAAFEEPARLLGLGYLPTGCTIVAAVHLAALREDDTGRTLLREPRPVLLEQLLQPLAATGLTDADVDHIIVGSDLKGFPPQMTTVIFTCKPYDPAAVKQAAAQEHISETTYRGRPLFRLTKRTGIPKLWCAAPRVLVYTTLTAEQMEQIPKTVKEPADTLTPAARDALTARLDKQSRIWAVGDLAPAKALIDMLQLIPLGPLKEPARLLTLVRTFDIGITTGAAAQQSVTVRGDFYTGSPAGTQELAKVLAGVTVSGAQSQKVETPPADLHAAEAQWVSWQLRGDAAALREALAKLSLTPPKKAP